LVVELVVEREHVGLTQTPFAAKRCRRRLERHCKKTGSDSDRIAYRAACRHANKLINASHNHFRCERIIDAGNNSRRVWSAVKDLHADQKPADTRSPDEDKAFCSTLASFFINKICNIKATIHSALTNTEFDPLESDLPHGGRNWQCLSA